MECNKHFISPMIIATSQYLDPDHENVLCPVDNPPIP